MTDTLKLDALYSTLLAVEGERDRLAADYESLHKRIRGLAVDSGVEQTDDAVEDVRRGMEALREEADTISGYVVAAEYEVVAAEYEAELLCKKVELYESALHCVFAATGHEAGGRDDFRALVDREIHTVNAVTELRELYDVAAEKLAVAELRISEYAASSKHDEEIIDAMTTERDELRDGNEGARVYCGRLEETVAVWKAEAMAARPLLPVEDGEVWESHLSSVSWDAAAKAYAAARAANEGRE